jgi:hypothetical protein
MFSGTRRFSAKNPYVRRVMRGRAERGIQDFIRLFIYTRALIVGDMIQITVWNDVDVKS